MTTVWASGGRRYHSSPRCDALERGRMLWDGDDWVPGCPSPRPVRELLEVDAQQDGLTRCRICYFPEPVSPSPDDFGHEPMDVVLRGEGGIVAEFTTCARCYPNALYWPCRTAGVLGLPE